MATSLGKLEEQISNLNALNKVSARALDSFADTSNAIAVRARRITRDVKPWEVSQENIAITIEEMTRAARCYHPPPSLPAVLSCRETSPEAVVRCIDYLVYTDDYLSSHPPNDYANNIQVETGQQLQLIVAISEELVKTCFIRAVSRGKAGGTGPKDSILRDPQALNGIGAVIQRLGQNFNQTSVIEHDVRDLLQEKLKAAVEGQFDGTYREGEVGKVSLSSHTSAGMPQLLKHYQKGEHRLIGISRRARAYVREVDGCLQQHVLLPLDDDYAVAEIPGEVATTAFDIIIGRATAAIQFDNALFSDPSRMFVLSRGQDVGLYPGARYFRDLIFVGLDLVEELWHWKAVATATHGDNHHFVDYVDDTVEKFIFNVRDLLNGYVTCKGALSKPLLMEYTQSLRRVEWFPAADCTVHESATNTFFFHKILFTGYYGALKLALYGGPPGQSAERDAVKEVQDFLIRCVLGTVHDLHVIAEAAVEMQEAAQERGHTRIHHTSLSLLTSDGEPALLSRQVFGLNNVTFLVEHYRREPCFSLRALPAEETSGSGGGVAETVVTEVLALLTEEVERNVDDFGYSWQRCFPPLFDAPDIGSISKDPQELLRKSQRMALKRWHKHVNEELMRKIRQYRTQAVMDGGLRTRLIDVSTGVIHDQFRLLADLLQGRAWSSRPQKWMEYSPEDWIDHVRKLF